MTQSEITIKNAGIQHLGVIPDKFQQLGIQMDFRGDDIHIPEQESYEIQRYFDGSTVTFSDHPWPGLTPDLLSIILVTAIHAKGSVLIHQKMFESRLFFVDKLIDMGAQIILCDPHRAIVVGPGTKTKIAWRSNVKPGYTCRCFIIVCRFKCTRQKRYSEYRTNLSRISKY